MKIFTKFDRIKDAVKFVYTMCSLGWDPKIVMVRGEFWVVSRKLS